jgi:hypothetical protein
LHDKIDNIADNVESLNNSIQEINDENDQLNLSGEAGLELPQEVLRESSKLQMDKLRSVSQMYGEHGK